MWHISHQRVAYLTSESLLLCIKTVSFIEFT